MPQVSVLMPVYNAERFLAAAIESILHQTFQDFEFLIIDDASTDNSVAIVQSYTDPRIRFYQNSKNLGISATLNRGIELAGTDWIARMDSDDISYLNRLERQWAFITQHPDGALFSCGARVVNENEIFVAQDDFDPKHFFYHLHFTCLIYHPTIVFKKSAVQSVGGYTVPFAEDYELYWQLTRGHKLYHQAETLLDYRQTSQSLHKVVHKREYEEAQLQQLLRNIRSVTSPQLQVPESHLHCLQHYFQPLEAENSIGSIVSFFKTLDYIAAGIVQTPNPNNIPEVTKEAAAAKRKFILEHFMRTLPPMKAAALLARLGECGYLAERVKGNLVRKK